MTHLQHIKDWRVLSFATLALIAGVVNLFKVIGLGNYAQLYIPIMWFIIFILTVILDVKIFFYVFTLIGIFIAFTNANRGYNDLAIFVLMILVTGKGNIRKIISLGLIAISSIIASSYSKANIINIFAILIQVGFALFCYYGFIILRTKDIDHCSKIICTPEERELIHALATQDKSQKEIAYELGMDYQDVTNILRRIRVKNKINTTDMLLRLYAIELSRQD